MRTAVGAALALALLAAQSSARAQPQGSLRLAQSSPLIAFQRTTNRVSQIYVMNVDGSDQRPLARGCCAAWSPDGQMIAFARANEGSGDLLVINRDGTGLRRIASIALGRPTWSPDGRQIAFSGEGARGAAIYVVNADGSGLARLTSPRAWSEDAAPAWSPDGTQIVFERYNATGIRGSPVIVMNADGTNQRVLTTKTVDASSPAWSADGRRIVFAAATRSPSEPSDIFSVNRDGSDQRNLTRTKSPDDTLPQFSADGRAIVFQSFTNGPGKRDVHVIGADGTRHVNLTRNRATDGLPAWTPDGRVVFVSTRDGNGDIYVMTSTGAGVTNLTNTPTELGYNRSPRWSPTP